ncbi:demethoxyubiquinone hydroxylase family protein [Chloroflexota bacterium]
MNTKLCALKFMYNMERFATQIYLTQRRAFRGSEIEGRLTKASANEQEHVDLLRKRTIELKERPSRIGFLFQLAGIIVGFATLCLGRKFVMKAGIRVERRAIRDYNSFIKRLDFDGETVSLLKQIITDEERHVETWQNSLKELRRK